MFQGLLDALSEGEEQPRHVRKCLGGLLACLGWQREQGCEEWAQRLSATGLAHQVELLQESPSKRVAELAQALVELHLGRDCN